MSPFALKVKQYALEAGHENNKRLDDAVEQLLKAWKSDSPDSCTAQANDLRKAGISPLQVIKLNLRCASVQDQRIRLLEDSVLRWHSLTLPIATTQPEVR